ncbi:MAG: hypothetical protein GY816_20440 [Cytophagales bacterium]|nr:hypothetical protein [Cytophagales bacterium]
MFKYKEEFLDILALEKKVELLHWTDELNSSSALADKLEELLNVNKIAKEKTLVIIDDLQIVSLPTCIDRTACITLSFHGVFI